MKTPKSPFQKRPEDRRSGINRRWIKSQYPGEERRSGSDRRTELVLKDPPALSGNDAGKVSGFEKMVISSTIQLEALIRLLIEKKIIDERDLYEVIKTVQAQYQQNEKE